MLKIYRWLVVALLLCANPPVAMANTSVLGGEKRIYIAQDESARQVLSNMLEIYGRKLAGSEHLPSVPISGKFEVRSVDEVMAYFKTAFQINWFQNGTTVYIYQSRDWRTSKIYVGGERSGEDWKEYITAAGLYYKEFPVVFQPDAKELVVSGPRSYSSLLEASFAVPRPDPSELEKHGVSLMVFPLKHASVEDRQTNLRETLITTPGALSVLLNLLGMPRQTATLAAEEKKPGMNVEKRSALGRPIENSSDRMARLPMSPTKGVNTSPSTDSDNKEHQNLPSITSDPRTNSILIRDAKSKYSFYKELIDKLDQPVAMIEVEAMMVEVNETAMKELGLEFGLLTPNLIYEMPSPSVSPNRILNPGFIGNAGGAYPPDFLPGSSSVVDPLRFMARLRALAADENAKVLARPTILTQDNVSAYIDLSQTIYVSLTGERVVDLLPVTAGSLLQVTPRLVKEQAEDKIFLRIEIQDGTLTDTSLNNIDRSPKIQNTSLSTQALIQRDKAILVGGYNRDSSSTRELKVPVLGDLPFIGGAFRSTEQKSSTVARLFLITPRLLEDPLNSGQSTRTAADQLRKSFKLSAPQLREIQSDSLRMDTQIGN